jgi:hypothetical protein
MTFLQIFFDCGIAQPDLIDSERFTTSVWTSASIGRSAMGEHCSVAKIANELVPTNWC